MRRVVLAATVGLLIATAMVAVPASASKAPPTTGPFAGFVAQGQTNAHLYHDPVPKQCILPVTYVVTLEYTPAGDILSLTANGITDEGSDGVAQVVFEGPCSTTFGILVTGVDVGLIATYTVTVGQGPPWS